MIEILIMLVAFIALAQKKEKDRIPRWIQITIDGTGGPKGGCGWLTQGLKVQPITIECATGADFEKDGYTLPDIVEGIEKKDCMIIYDKDSFSMPLLVHQKYAVRGIHQWLTDRMKIGDLHGVTEWRGPVDIFHLDQTKPTWELTFKRGKKEFDPFLTTFFMIPKGK